MDEHELDILHGALVNGDVAGTQAAVKVALAAGWKPLVIINSGCQPAMDTVGELFYRGEAFLPDLIKAGRAMTAALDVLLPSLQSEESALVQQGRMVLCTVKSDMHDIGKSLVKTMLAVSGFEITDLGVNVPTKEILQVAKSIDADIIGTSSLLTTSLFYQEELIRYATELGLRDRFYFIVGGGSVTPEFAREIGADGWARSAAGATELCRKLVGGRVAPPLASPLLVDK
jgi:methylmalonyl-CoA mutase cobalamin-binding domain/chain